MSVVGISEVGAILGVSRQRAAQIAAEHSDFPQPIAQLRSGRVWDEAAVRAWVTNHPDRRPGRPPHSPDGPDGPDGQP
ncbi:MAG: DNA-binding protein [Acidimicrobiales bacterium]